MWILYGFLILFRLYLAGLTFSLLCHQTGIQNRYGILAGSMTYTFCSWVLTVCVPHPFFLNPMIFLPLLILGVENVIAGKHPLLLTVTVFFSAISNFYFFYILVLSTVIYVIVRLVFLYRSDIRKIFLSLLMIGAYSLLGVIMSAFIFYPVIFSFLSSNRMSVSNNSQLFYPLQYYSQLPGTLFSTDSLYQMCMGYAVAVLPALLLLFHKKRKYQIYKCLYLICFVIMMFPFLGRVFNGFSYVTNRWCWAFALLSAYILSLMWPFLTRLTAREHSFLIICTAIYLFLCLLAKYSRSEEVFSSIAFLLLIFLLLHPSPQRGILCYNKQALLLILTLISIINHSFWLNSPSAGNRVSQYRSIDKMEELTHTEAEAVQSLAAEDYESAFYRYSGRKTTLNANMIAGVSSTSYYWSISNPYAASLRTSLGIRDISSYTYTDYDAGTALTALTSVLYYVVPEGDSSVIPYGFSYITTVNTTDSSTAAALDALKKELNTENLSEEQVDIITNQTASKYDVYKNDYPLSLAYTYKSALPESRWDALNAVEKREALLHSIVIDDLAPGSESVSLPSCPPLSYNITCDSSEITLQDNAFIVTSGNAKATLSFQGLSNSETYFVINGLSFQDTPEYDLYFGSQDLDPANLYTKTRWNLLPFETQQNLYNKKKYAIGPDELTLGLRSSADTTTKLTYYTPDYTYYCGRHNFAINLGYTQEALSSVTISFEFPGIYTFENMQIICQPMESYPSLIKERSETPLDSLTIGTDTVTGTMTSDVERWLCFSIPYSDGWQAYVDDSQVPLYRANIQYMAVKVGPGTHTVRLAYKTPRLKTGICISLMGFILFFAVFFIQHRQDHSYIPKSNR